MAEVELIGVPFDGYGRPGNQARAAGVLRDHGLAQAFAGHDVTAADDVDLPAPTSARGEDTSLVNEPAILALVDALGARVGPAVAVGRFPVVYGGDCTTLLGTVPSLRDHVGAVGALVVDGHEDTMPLDVSEDGEAANAEVGLLLGTTGRLLRGPLAARLPALATEHLALLGHRDAGWRARFNVGSLAGLGVWSRSLDDVAGAPAEAARAAVAHLRAGADRWWLHIDLDVVDPVQFPAQGLPDVEDEPGGLTWPQLTELAVAAVEAGGCVGLSLAIYDPDQDPDGTGADAIVDLASTLAGRLTG